MLRHWNRIGFPLVSPATARWNCGGAVLHAISDITLFTFTFCLGQYSRLGTPSNMIYGIFISDVNTLLALNSCSGSPNVSIVFRVQPLLNYRSSLLTTRTQRHCVTLCLCFMYFAGLKGCIFESCCYPWSTIQQRQNCLSELLRFTYARLISTTDKSPHGHDLQHYSQ